MDGSQFDTNILLANEAEAFDCCESTVIYGFASETCYALRCLAREMVRQQSAARKAMVFAGIPDPYGNLFNYSLDNYGTLYNPVPNFRQGS